MLNEFQLLGGWTIGLERVNRKMWEIFLVSPDRKSVFSLGTHPAGFWADWTRTKKSAKEFVSKITSRLQVSEEEVRRALEKVYSEIKIQGLKTERRTQEGQHAGSSTEPSVYRCENCGHEFASVSIVGACPKCGKTRVRKITEDELKEREEIRQIQNNPDEMKEITKELTPEELTQILGLTIKHDNTNKLIHMLGMILTYTEEDQINISNRGPSATGKSYIPIEIASLYFPRSDLRLLAYASPTAFFHDMMEWDEERKAFWVDLEKKILIFLDQPHDALLRRLRPLLSHDQKELEVKITDRGEKKGLRTKTVVIRGFPTVVFCTGGLRMDEQEATRSFVLSPETTIEKIREAIYLKAERKGNPLAYAEMINRNKNHELLRKRILLIKYANIKNIVIENPREIAEKFMETYKNLKPRHTRDIERVISLAKAFALLNLWNRKREGNTLYVDSKDIERAFKLYKEIAECQELGVPPYVFRVFQEVILPLYWEKRAESANQVENREEDEEENKVGLAHKEIIRKFYETYDRPLPRWVLERELLPALESANLVFEDVDPHDRRRKLVYLNERYVVQECGVGGGVCSPSTKNNALSVVPHTRLQHISAIAKALFLIKGKKHGGFKKEELVEECAKIGISEDAVKVYLDEEMNRNPPTLMLAGEGIYAFTSNLTGLVPLRFVEDVSNMGEGSFQKGQLAAVSSTLAHALVMAGKAIRVEEEKPTSWGRVEWVEMGLGDKAEKERTTCL
jgi:Zn finger protein HypA/HybF involved in hydrogenase expression